MLHDRNCTCCHQPAGHVIYNYIHGLAKPVHWALRGFIALIALSYMYSAGLGGGGGTGPMAPKLPHI